MVLNFKAAARIINDDANRHPIHNKTKGYKDYKPEKKCNTVMKWFLMK